MKNRPILPIDHGFQVSLKIYTKRLTIFIFSSLAIFLLGILYFRYPNQMFFLFITILVQPISLIGYILLLSKAPFDSIISPGRRFYATLILSIVIPSVIFFAEYIFQSTVPEYLKFIAIQLLIFGLIASITIRYQSAKVAKWLVTQVLAVADVINIFEENIE